MLPAELLLEGELSFAIKRGKPRAQWPILNSCPPTPAPRAHIPSLRVGITARAHPGPASVDLTPTRGNMAEALAQNKQPRLCADPALSGSLMLICPGSLPSVTSALPGRPSRGNDCTPSHVSVFLWVASPALFYSPSSQVWAKRGIFKACLQLEVKGDIPRRVHLSHPLWQRKDPVATRGESDTGLKKTCDQPGSGPWPPGPGRP